MANMVVPEALGMIYWEKKNRIHLIGVVKKLLTFAALSKIETALSV